MRIFAGLLLLTLTSVPAQSTVCLSKSEARELWPRQHIYWYSKDHCWSNRRGPPRNLRIDPITNFHVRAEEKEKKDDKAIDVKKPKELKEDKCCWPPLERDKEGNIIEPPRAFSE